MSLGGGRGGRHVSRAKLVSWKTSFSPKLVNVRQSSSKFVKMVRQSSSKFVKVRQDGTERETLHVSSLPAHWKTGSRQSSSKFVKMHRRQHSGGCEGLARRVLPLVGVHTRLFCPRSQKNDAPQAEMKPGLSKPGLSRPPIIKFHRS